MPRLFSANEAWVMQEGDMAPRNLEGYSNYYHVLCDGQHVRKHCTMEAPCCEHQGEVSAAGLYPYGFEKEAPEIDCDCTCHEADLAD
jgi:hypothetical protein